MKTLTIVNLKKVADYQLSAQEMMQYEKNNNIVNGAWAYLSNDNEGTLILKPITSKFQIFSEGIENVSNDDFYQNMMKTLTFNVVFNDSDNSNDKGFSDSLDYCMSYIKKNNGTNESYFADYKGGIVQVVCNETGDVMHEEVVR